MPPRISPLKDAMHHVVTKSDKTKLEVNYINAVKGKVVSGMTDLSLNNYEIWNHNLVSME